jgi:hypothetical protein
LLDLDFEPGADFEPDVEVELGAEVELGTEAVVAVLGEGIVPSFCFWHGTMFGSFGACRPE